MENAPLDLFRMSVKCVSCKIFSVCLPSVHVMTSTFDHDPNVA